MIDMNEFTEGFEPVIASFSRTIHKRNITIWFDEVKHLDADIFKKTCYQLKRGDKFPNFGDFHKMYQAVKGQPGSGYIQDFKGCGKCHSGWIIYYFEEDVDKRTFVAYCENCVEKPLGKPILNSLDTHMGDKKIKIIPKITGDKFVPKEAVRALFKILASGNFNVVGITPNEAIELAEGVEDLKSKNSEKEKIRKQNIWESEKAERVIQ